MKTRAGFAKGSRLGSCRHSQAPVHTGIQAHPLALEGLRIRIQHGPPARTLPALALHWAASGAGSHLGQSLGAMRRYPTQTWQAGGQEELPERQGGGVAKAPPCQGTGQPQADRRKSLLGTLLAPALLNGSPVRRAGQG